MSSGALAPGRTIGILGGGQLGLMLAEAARSLGYKTAALDPAPDAPALQFVDLPMVGAIDDPASARRLAAASDVLTLEWELIPGPVLAEAARLRPLHPAPSVLDVIRDRLDQRKFLARRGFPQTEFGAVTAPDSLPYFPIIVKRRTHGYDGKGQARFASEADVRPNRGIFEAPCVWEKIVPFEKEISVILARGRDGKIAAYPVAENLHRAGILTATRAPARISEATAASAVALASRVAEELGHVGVLAVELFLLPDGNLLINEIAPRVHNSGHYTLGACPCSQFEQHIRAVAGLPLAPTVMLGPAVMVNLLGELWANGEPPWSILDDVPGLTRRLYGKSSARPGRKMGHYIVAGSAAASEWSRVDERLDALGRRTRRRAGF